MTPETPKRRCEWAAGSDAVMLAYHDEEWGRPVHDERRLFEMLTLEGAQAGLSWATILMRREGYRAAFADWDIDAIAAFEEADVARLLGDPGIIRNRLKVAATIDNARAALRLREAGTSLDHVLWAATGGRTLVNAPRSISEIAAETPESRALSRTLKSGGFRFVGPTICYALMQACGMVNDHEAGCFRYAELTGR